MSHSVTAIMTCHNERAFIEQAVLSVAEQTAADRIVEIIVVNDRSTDGSQAVLDALCARLPKLRILQGEGRGVSAARNLALAETKGDLIAILDGDDYWTPDKLASQLPAFADPRVGIVYGDWYDVDMQAGTTRLVTARRFTADSEDTLARYFVDDAPIIPSTAIVRRAVFDDVGLFDVEIRWGEDTDFCLRTAERWRFQHVPGGLLYKRAHGGNLTSNLERLLPVQEMLTRRFAERNPELGRFRRQRMGRRYAVVGNNCAMRGEIAKASRYFAAALRSDPFQARTWAYVGLATIPTGLSKRVRSAIKHVVHRRARAPGEGHAAK